MAIKYPPKPGTIVICNYDTGFVPPEMVKERLAIVVSPRLPHRDNLCTVVPLSTTPARSGIRYQCRIDLPMEPPPPYAGRIKWAKADMLSTVSYNRLVLPYTRRDEVTKQRKYIQIILPVKELLKVQCCILFALGLDNLTERLAK